MSETLAQEPVAAAGSFGRLMRIAAALTFGFMALLVGGYLILGERPSAPVIAAQPVETAPIAAAAPIAPAPVAAPKARHTLVSAQARHSRRDCVHIYRTGRGETIECAL